MSENATPHYPDLYDASIAELNQGLNSGLFSSLDLTKAYLARISEVNPQVHAVIETNPRALEYAAALDTERAERGPRGPLHGIPILLKDNITSDPGDGMQSTAGSFALLGAVSHRPAFITSRLIAAGAIILGKANLSEWAMFRGANPSGWSGRGGQTTNPYVPNGDPGGSSSGSGVAAAIGLAAACVGTETDGSIISPSRRNNIVGLKPTVGLTSRDGVIPVSFTQDSVGPMARYVSDVALLLSAMAGQDSRDAYTLYQPTPLPDYTTFLSSEALRGARIGVPRALLAPAEKLESDIQNFEDALRILQTLGAELIDDVSMPAILGLGERIGLLPSELRVVETEFRPGFEKYVSELREVPTGVRTVEDLIEFNEKHADKELILPHYASQSRLISCKSLVMDDEYRKAVQDGYKVGRTDGIDAALIKYKLDALVLPADGNFNASAVAGYPILTVPLGSRSANTPVRPGDGPLIDIAPNLPTGLAFFGGAWSEAKLLAYGYAFEQATLARKKTKAYKEATPRTGLEAILKV